MAKSKVLKRVLLSVLAVVLVMVALVGQKLASFLSTEEVRFDEKCWAMLGGGGNTLVLESPDGPLVVDTKFMSPAGKLREAIERISGKPPKMVVNTHFHSDHTGGNPRYVGAEIVAAPTVPEHLRQDQPGVYGAGKEGERSIPGTLVSTTRTFAFGDEQVEVRYLGRGHTDGDVVVWLPRRSILHMGDLYVNGYYPLVDMEHGASVREWVGVLDQAIALNPAKVIPGHGPVCTTAEVKVQRDYLAALWEAALAAARAGRSADQAASDFDPSRFGLKTLVPVIGSWKANMKAAWSEAKAWVAAGH